MNEYDKPSNLQLDFQFENGMLMKAFIKSVQSIRSIMADNVLDITILL